MSEPVHREDEADPYERVQRLMASPSYRQACPNSIL